MSTDTLVAVSGQPQEAAEPARSQAPTAPLQRRIARAGLRPLAWSAPYLARIGPLRRAVARYYERWLQAGSQRALARGIRPPGAEADRLALGLAILHTAEHALAENRLRATTLRAAASTLIGDNLIGQGDWSAKRSFHARFDANPPSFLAISPTKSCNLRCTGCYADSGATREKLPWATFDRIISEAHDLWGARFFVISGGEPMTYRDDSRGLLDAAAQHPDCFFLMYTNGTLITDEVARRMAELGNITPAISAEGLAERTDRRRGAGTFDRVVAAMTRLRREKVMFGVSMTATRENADDLLSDEVVDFFFEKMGCFYGWLFHYMPIGRAFTLDLMPTPQQRAQLWQRMWQIIRERKIFIADFWNSATVTDGCISAGRDGGYMYVDWNGAVSPCIFMPYAATNIQAAYSQGKTLNDVWAEPFFDSLRAWQHERGFQRPMAAGGRHANWLMDCPIRDNHADLRRLLIEFEPEPIDDNAAAALIDTGYHDGMEAFDRELAGLMDPVWETRYMGSAIGGQEVKLP
jgi:MoaA/NifB/PqqE/SkfB family radical SAM enzyme